MELDKTVDAARSDRRKFKFSAMVTKAAVDSASGTVCGKTGCGRFHRFTDLITTTSFMHFVSRGNSQQRAVVAVHILRNGMECTPYRVRASRWISFQSTK